jgi:hypothetical protein
MDDAPKPGPESPSVDLSCPFDGQTALLEWLYAQSQAGRWEIPRERFAAALERSVRKAFTPGTVTPQKLQNYLCALHLEDLALAVACAEGGKAPWEHFFAAYRAYLRTAAAAILRCPASSAEACDLADSLFSELYGLAGGKGTGRSLFRYFHGRSSLKTWLRAVLAQRHIDSLRAGRRFEELAKTNPAMEDCVHNITRRFSLSTRIGNATSPSLPALCRPLSITLTRRKRSGFAFITPRKKRLPKSGVSSASTNPASRAICTASAAIYGRPWKAFFAMGLQPRTVSPFSPGLAMRRSLFVSSTARETVPSIWKNCCPARNHRARQQESGPHDRAVQETGRISF